MLLSTLSLLNGEAGADVVEEPSVFEAGERIYESEFGQSPEYIRSGHNAREVSLRVDHRQMLYALLLKWRRAISSPTVLSSIPWYIAEMMSLWVRMLTGFPVDRSTTTTLLISWDSMTDIASLTVLSIPQVTGLRTMKSLTVGETVKPVFPQELPEVPPSPGAFSSR